jgi:hypothetical protein
MDRFLFAKNPMNLHRPAEHVGYVIDTVWAVFYEVKRFPGDVYTVTIARDITGETDGIRWPSAAIRWLKSYLKHEDKSFTKVVFEP